MAKLIILFYAKPCWFICIEYQYSMIQKYGIHLTLQVKNTSLLKQFNIMLTFSNFVICNIGEIMIYINVCLQFIKIQKQSTISSSRSFTQIKFSPKCVLKILKMPFWKPKFQKLSTPAYFSSYQSLQHWAHGHWHLPLKLCPPKPHCYLSIEYCANLHNHCQFLIARTALIQPQPLG